MARILTKEEWLRRKCLKRRITILTTGALVLTMLILFVFFIEKAINRNSTDISGKETLTLALTSGEEILVDYLSPNPYSRPKTLLKKVKGVVVHYTANPGTSAENNRSYFQGLATKKTTRASSHYIIGLEGEVIQCIPLTEVAYASNDRNDDTISIECCHPNETGEFNEETYASLVALTAALCIEFELKEEDVIRHYDVTEKLCPLYYVEHEDAWEVFQSDVTDEVEAVEQELVKSSEERKTD